MVNKVAKSFVAHWRDIIAILTVLLVLGSLLLISYSVRQTRDIAEQQRSQINCIAKFYTKSNRQNKVITNIDACSIRTK